MRRTEDSYDVACVGPTGVSGCPGIVVFVHNQVRGADAEQSSKGGKLGDEGFRFCVLLIPHANSSASSLRPQLSLSPPGPAADKLLIAR